MSSERKTMVSFRLSDSLLKRVDFIAGNTDNDALASRSAVILAAIEQWLPNEENALRQHLRKVGAAFPERK